MCLYGLLYAAAYCSALDVETPVPQECVPNVHDALFEWVKESGGYIHRCLEYRNAKMYTTCSIPKETTMVAIPNSLIIGHKYSKAPYNYNATIMTVLIAQSLARGHIQNPYTDSLPSICQTPMCRPIDRHRLTLLGARRMDRIGAAFREMEVTHQTSISVVKSRSWPSGMIPVIDLFNHDCSAKPPHSNGTHVVLNSVDKSYDRGDQVFNNYGIRSQWQSYFNYGFMDDCVVPTCEDARVLRFDGHEELRIDCIANSVSNITDMAAEMAEAIEVNDTVMISGIVRWMSKNK